MSSSRTRGVIATATCLLALAAITAFASAPLFASAVPPGYDAVMHLSKIAIFTRSFPAVPDWFPWWYCGTPSLRFYPPASYLAATAASGLLHLSAVEGYRIAATATFLLAGLFAFLFVRALGCGRPAGLGAAALYMLSPQTLYGRFFIGQYTHDFSMFLMPFVLFCLARWGRDVRTAVLATAPVFALLYLTHLHTALALVAMLAAGVIVGLVASARDQERGPVATWGIVIAAVIGAMLAGFWLLPSLLEGAGKLDLTVEAAKVASVPLASLFVSADRLSGLDSLQQIWLKQYFVGVPLIVLGALALVLLVLGRVDRRRTFWGAVLVSGVAVYLFAVVAPRLGLVLGWPNRFPYYVAMPLALFSGLSIQWLDERLFARASGVAGGFGRLVLAGIVIGAALFQVGDVNQYAFHPYSEDFAARDWYAKNVGPEERVGSFGTEGYVLNTFSDRWQLGGGYVQGQVNADFTHRYQWALTQGDSAAVMDMMRTTNARCVVFPLDGDVPSVYRNTSLFDVAEVGGYRVFRLRDDHALSFVAVTEGRADVRHEYSNPDRLRLSGRTYTARAAFLVRMNDYPAWRIRPRVAGVRMGEDPNGLMRVEVDGARDFDVTLAYGAGPLDFSGWALSLLGLLLYVRLLVPGFGRRGFAGV